ncbi:MAG: hypothetical protein C0184_09735 [Chloroflexus aggregans]|uniref:DUF7847 domain-containing protein n=1 Tax=Chloroflexus aggregans TaxID=152260 RepID=A0A2J6X3H6_9CHLR|nr:MAG: hypothetical protein C0184_09735 [Chloroflexus aggregans]
MLFIGSIVEGAAIVQTVLLDQRGQFDLSNSFAVGVSRMTSLALMDLLLVLPVLVVWIGILVAFGAVVASVLTMASDGLSASMLGLGVLTILGLIICLAIPILLWSLFFAVFRPLEGQGPVAGIKRGWQVLRRNLGQAVVVWLVTFGIGLVYSLPVGAIGGVVVCNRRQFGDEFRCVGHHHRVV